MTELERELENYLISRVRSLGGITAKMTIIGRRGWPDRLVVLPGGTTALVELKRSHKSRWSKPQRMLHQQLTDLGADAVRLCSRDDVDRFLRQRTFRQGAFELSMNTPLMEHLRKQGYPE